MRGRGSRGALTVALAVAAVFVYPGAVAAQTPTAPMVNDSFNPTSIKVGASTTLTFTITNPSGNDTLTNVGFTDILPADLIISTPTGITASCQSTTASGNGTFAPQGASTIALSGAVIAPGQTCAYTVDVTGTQPGSQSNQPGSLTDDQNDPGIFPLAPITVALASPPSIAAAFGTSLLGLDGTTSLTFTISNPNSDAGLTGVGFTDTLPSGVVVVGPNGVGNSCGGAVTAAEGSAAIALAGGTLPPGASCSVSENVTATSKGTFMDTSSAVTSNEGGAGNAASATLTVIGGPVVSVTSPVGGAKYAFGQKVRATYTCADDPNGPGVSACIGTVASGALIDTGEAGERSFSVVAISRDGGIASDLVFYTVAPNNRVNVGGHVKVRRDGSIDFTVAVPGPGRIDVLETAPDQRAAAHTAPRRPSAGHFAFGRADAVVKRAARVRFIVKPDARGRQAVRTAHALHVVVWLTYTPHGGTARTISFQVRIPASTQT